MGSAGIKFTDEVVDFWRTHGLSLSLDCECPQWGRLLTSPSDFPHLSDCQAP